jgi:hypothetical protein
VEGAPAKVRVGTRLIEFGRFAAEDRKRRGEGKPETFNFLGFTHICAKTRKPAASRSIARLSVSDSQQNSKLYGRSFGGAGTNQWPKSGSGGGSLYKDTSTTMRCPATSIVCGYPGSVSDACRSVDPQCCDSAPTSCVALQRQVSEVRAVCSNPARTDRCGGPGVHPCPYRDCGRGQWVTTSPMPIFLPPYFCWFCTCRRRDRLCSFRIELCGVN